VAPTPRVGRRSRKQFRPAKKTQAPGGTEHRLIWINRERASGRKVDPGESNKRNSGEQIMRIADDRTPPRFPVPPIPTSVAPWSVRETDYPGHAQLRDKLRFFLRYAILAPSTYNSQPWRFRIGDDSIDILADRDRGLPVVDPDGRELLISCGAVACLIRTAAANFGYATAVTVLPDARQPELVARVRVTGAFSPRGEDRARFRAIPSRRRNVLCFDNSPPSRPLLKSLAGRARRLGAHLVYIEDAEAKETAVRLITEADRLQIGNTAFREELSRWCRQGEAGCDGIPLDWHQGSSCLPEFGAPVWSEAIGSAGPVEYRAARVKQRVGSPPLLAVLGTDTDTPSDWVAAGQALLDAELEARAAGVWFTDFNQPIQQRKSREQLGDLAGVAFPQALIRIGYGAEVAPTPRRNLEDLLLAD
jgi:nitroreductase